MLWFHDQSSDALDAASDVASDWSRDALVSPASSRPEKKSKIGSIPTDLVEDEPRGDSDHRNRYHMVPKPFGTTDLHENRAPGKITRNRSHMATKRIETTDAHENWLSLIPPGSHDSFRTVVSKPISGPGSGRK